MEEFRELYDYSSKTQSDVNNLFDWKDFFDRDIQSLRAEVGNLRMQNRSLESDLQAQKEEFHGRLQELKTQMETELALVRAQARESSVARREEAVALREMIQNKLESLQRKA